MRSFVELSTILLAVPGVQYILSEKLSQDPIKIFLASSKQLEDIMTILQYKAFAVTQSP